MIGPLKDARACKDVIFDAHWVKLALMIYPATVRGAGSMETIFASLYSANFTDAS